MSTTGFALLGTAVGVVWFGVILAWTLWANARHAQRAGPGPRPRRGYTGQP